jgi:hypothetical protein
MARLVLNILRGVCSLQPAVFRTYVMNRYGDFLMISQKASRGMAKQKASRGMAKQKASRGMAKQKAPKARCAMVEP